MTGDEAPMWLPSYYYKETHGRIGASEVETEAVDAIFMKIQISWNTIIPALILPNKLLSGVIRT